MYLYMPRTFLTGMKTENHFLENMQGWKLEAAVQGKKNRKQKTHKQTKLPASLLMKILNTLKSEKQKGI